MKLISTDSCPVCGGKLIGHGYGSICDTCFLIITERGDADYTDYALDVTQIVYNEKHEPGEVTSVWNADKNHRAGFRVQ